ncbi:MAG: hypothetical protein EA404_07945 [Spirochaetaceae bacterium]|nr:MAG: hypothetical protein EA404_07945 [Spirochaetaceae bacterium]
MRARRIVPLILIALAATAAAHAISLPGLELRAGPTWIGNAYREYPDGSTVQGSDVSPLRIFGGAALPLVLQNGLILTPGIDFYWQEYLAAAEDGKVVPTQIETGSAAGDAAGTLGILLSMPVNREWQVRQRLVLAAGAGPAFLLRLPLAPIEGSDVSALWSYFYSGLRFFYPETQGSIRYQVSDQFEFGGLLRVLWPVASLWSQYDVAVWDEMKISLMALVRVRLEGRAADDDGR